MRGQYEPLYKRSIPIQSGNTCVAGLYNSIVFDDEVTRYASIVILINPWLASEEWQNGNSRWDHIDLLGSYAFASRGITAPVNDEVITSFKLQELVQP